MASVVTSTSNRKEEKENATEINQKRELGGRGEREE